MIAGSGNVGVSLKPEDAQAGGGILEALNGEEATITKCRFCLWDYGNPQYGQGLFLNVVYDLANGDGEFDQKYSAGKSKSLVPANDGRSARPVDEDAKKTGLPEGCNALIWLTEARNAGFPDHLITNDASVFEGTKVSLVVKPQPKRAGLEKEDGKQKDILVVGKILALPGAVAGPAKGKKKSVTQTASAPSESAGGKTTMAVGTAPEAVHARAIDVVMQVLAEKGGACPKVAIANAAFKIMQDAKDPLRNEVSKLVFKDEFLSAEDTPWQFDGTTVSL